jgi:hypothetical protein
MWMCKPSSIISTANYSSWGITVSDIIKLSGYFMTGQYLPPAMNVQTSAGDSLISKVCLFTIKKKSML